MRSKKSSSGAWALLLLVLSALTLGGCSGRTGPEVQFIYGRSNVSIYYPEQGKLYLYNAGSGDLEAVYTIPATPGGRLVKASQ